MKVIYVTFEEYEYLMENDLLDSDENTCYIVPNDGHDYESVEDLLVDKYIE